MCLKEKFDRRINSSSFTKLLPVVSCYSIVKIPQKFYNECGIIHIHCILRSIIVKYIDMFTQVSLEVVEESLQFEESLFNLALYP